MIVVRQVEGVRRLVCEANHTISFFNDTPDMEIEVGSIGAEVELEEGREVDWWATYGIFVESGACIERSYISAEVGQIEAYSVIVGSLIDSMDIAVRSNFPDGIASVRNSRIRADAIINIVRSSVQGSTLDHGQSVTIMSSDVERCVLPGNTSVIRSSMVETVVAFREADTKDTSFIREMFGTKLQSIPMTTNVACSTINDVEISDRSSAFAVQCSTLRECVLDGDFVIASSIFNKTNIIGDMVSSINCILANVGVNSKASSMTMIDLRKIDESSEECNYFVIIGDHPERVIG